MNCKRLSLDCMSDNDVQSFLYFKEVINNLVNKYSHPCVVIDEVIPIRIINDKYDTIALTVGYGPFVICYNVDNMGENKNEIMSDAIHEFLHMWFNTYSYEERSSVIKCICNETMHVLGDDIILQAKYSIRMVYMSEMLNEYSFSEDLYYGEEVLCELASHLKSPVREIVFNIIINREILKKDLDDLSKKLHELL